MLSVAVFRSHACGVADANDQIGETERRLTKIQDDLVGMEREVVSQEELAAALKAFDGAWDALKSRE